VPIYLIVIVQKEDGRRRTTLRRKTKTTGPAGSKTTERKPLGSSLQGPHGFVGSAAQPQICSEVDTDMQIPLLASGLAAHRTPGQAGHDESHQGQKEEAEQRRSFATQEVRR